MRCNSRCKAVVVVVVVVAVVTLMVVVGGIHSITRQKGRLLVVALAGNGGGSGISFTRMSCKSRCKALVVVVVFILLQGKKAGYLWWRW